MKKPLIVTAFLIFLFSSILNTKELFSIDEISRPSMFLTGFDRIYILEDASVYVYSLKDHKLIKKFGKAGEGPEEFKYNRGSGRPLSMSFYEGELIVNSEMKLSYFDPDGNFLREKKVKVDRLLFPVRRGYLGIGPTRGKDKRYYIGYTVYDKDFKSSKVIYLSDVEIGNPKKLVLPVSSFTYNPVYKDKIFINANSNEFKINVYASGGKPLKVISKLYPKSEVKSEFRKDTLHFFKTNPRFRNNFELVKKILEIREFYPPVRDIQVKEDSIYVMTFKKQGQKWQCLKFDLDGNELGEAYIPLDELEPFTMYPLFYSVYGGKVYSLVSDEEEETWKVHLTEFK